MGKNSIPFLRRDSRNLDLIIRALTIERNEGSTTFSANDSLEIDLGRILTDSVLHHSLPFPTKIKVPQPWRWLRFLRRPATVRRPRDESARRACEAMDKAIRATLDYTAGRRAGQAIHRTTEKKLTGLWVKASMLVAEFEPELASVMHVKGMGWTDRQMWDMADRDDVDVSIEAMEQARQNLNQILHMEANVNPIPSWYPIAGAAFLLLTIIFFMYIYINPGPSGPGVVLTLISSFCAAASFAFIGGSAAASGKLPLFKDSPIGFSMGGGVAVFVIVLLLVNQISS